MPVERRASHRHPRRLEVRFWKRGESHPHPAITSNISTSGMFIQTSAPIAPGDRLRLEVVERDRGFFVEGVVARVQRVAPILRQLEQPGAGLRFLSIAELVLELIPTAHAVSGPRLATPGPAPESDAVTVDPPAAANPGPAGAPQVGGSTTASETVAGEASAKVDGSGASAAVGAVGAVSAIGAIGDDRPVFRIDFANEEEFLRTFRRDIANGGLFVATATPANLDQHVVIELAFSEPDLAPVKVPARVVHCFAPEEGAARNLLSGMGVEFLDPRSALASLRPVLARYRV